MKKFNKNSLVFGFTIVFVIVGFFGSAVPSLAKSFSEKVSGVDSGSVKDKMIAMWNSMHDNTDESLSYFTNLMDLNSVKENLLGTKMMIKSDTTVIKSNSENLSIICEPLSDEEIQQTVDKISQLKRVTENSGANFLYCAAPNKEYYETFPDNFPNPYRDNYARFITELQESNIPYINFVDTFSKTCEKRNDIFFVTDSHWKPRTGFMANRYLCEELGTRYGFSYNEKYIDIGNYEIKKYKNWFLGCWGKKTGTYFTWKGADDFELFTPRFATDLLLEEPLKKEKKEGKFEDTVLYLENLEKDYYNKESYAVYNGGNRQLQIVKNNLNPNGKKVLIVRDSFACVVTPFLSLQTSELHICDVRKHQDGEIIDVEDYIKKMSPDYVIFLYAGVGKQSNPLYNFF